MTIPQALQIALQHHQAGRLADAEALYRQILAAQPDHADALHFLGVIAHQTGRDELSMEWIRQAIALNPTNPAAHSNLGEACRATGRLDEAIAAYHRALELNPDYPEALNNLGAALARQGHLDKAVDAFQNALRLRPDYPEALNNLGNTLIDRGQIPESIDSYRHALRLKPNYPEAENNLANALKDARQPDEAVAASRRALRLKPDFPEAHNNLGNALAAQGHLDEAVASYRRALELRPEDPGMHSNLVYTLHYHPGPGNVTLPEERRRWNRRFSDPVKQYIQPHTNDRTASRRLRIGYVSPDFWDHVVGRNLLPLFQCHDRRNFELLCYSGVVKPDQLTDKFLQHAHHWRNTLGVGDQALAEMIRQDGVDILVDLSQHTARNRLPMFARKPAPVQVSFAGYPDTTGLEAIEYRISDRYLEGDSSDASDARTEGRERVFHIDSFWCYDPCGINVEINALPGSASGTVTFGSLNNFYKVNPRALSLWARVLEKVKDSRLVISSPAGSHRQRTLELLKREGVEAQRVQFVEYHPRREYLELYHRLDIALDTFPYNGHTTSLDALWMGVPVVSLAGDTPVSRAGLSQLTNLGLPELAAHSEAEYVNIATSLAGDLPRLAELRATLRPRMQASPLMDAPRFARNVEAAYRSMWQNWVTGGCD